MRKTGKRFTALAVSLAVVLGSSIGCVAAQKLGGAEAITSLAKDKTGETASVVTETEPETETADVSLNTTEDKEVITTDDEVVYVFTDSEGKVKKVMDSIWISNNEDKTRDEKDADLPISVDIKYFLDGKAAGCMLTACFITRRT